MTIHNWLIIALWLVLIAFWAVAALYAKPSVGARFVWRESALRLSVIALVLLALRIPALRSLHYAATTNAIIGVVGVVLCALGIGLAISARAWLGRNWGMPMSRKQEPELITDGPYAFVRHPIYGGLLLAMLGSTLGQSVLWAVPLILFGAYFIYSARREEQLMTEQFPQQYPAYMRRTKMLLPFML